MNSADVYGYIFERMSDFLLPRGFKRSGKMFYRYAGDKRIGTAIEMQKSMNNSPEEVSFTFNLTCVGIYDVHNYFKDKLTLQVIRQALYSFDCGMRLGHLTRGSDYWWTVDDDILEIYTLEEYYDNFMKNDIERAVQHLDELESRKMQYLKN